MLTAASAQQSGTVDARIMHNRVPWAGATIRWHAQDLSVSQDFPRRRGEGRGEFRLVGGMMYGLDPTGEGWLELGSPNRIDPGSGTTPADYLAAVREDVGGATLRRITHGVTGLTTTHNADGSTVYSGTVAAGLIAGESGFKEGRAIRLLPLGYAAHDEAASPAAPLAAAVTVGADGVVRGLVVTWGTWRYAVAYSGLGSTAAPKAPANAKPLRR